MTEPDFDKKKKKFFSAVDRTTYVIPIIPIHSQENSVPYFDRKTRQQSNLTQSVRSQIWWLKKRSSYQTSITESSRTGPGNMAIMITKSL
jgi:hypothetical protein